MMGYPGLPSWKLFDLGDNPNPMVERFNQANALPQLVAVLYNLTLISYTFGNRVRKYRKAEKGIALDAESENLPDLRQIFANAESLFSPGTKAYLKQVRGDNCLVDPSAFKERGASQYPQMVNEGRSLYGLVTYDYTQHPNYQDYADTTRTRPIPW
jgi:hypothetical protein